MVAVVAFRRSTGVDGLAGGLFSSPGRERLGADAARVYKSCALLSLKTFSSLTEKCILAIDDCGSLSIELETMD